MESSQESEELPQVLTASVRDLRHFTSLLRGINFVNRALVEVTGAGLVVTVEEARTLLGMSYIHHDVFDDYQYNPQAAQPYPSQSSSNDPDPDTDTPDRTVFEIQLNTLIECLNIFGTAGGLSNSNATPKRKYRNWHDRAPGRDSDSGSGGEEGGPSSRGGRHQSRFGGHGPSANGGIEQYLMGVKGTGLRMSYAGPGYPLTLLIAEDSNGPTATCEITTFDAEPVLELPYDPDQTVLKIILKSSWLQDALSELHPSCEKLTIIGNPPPPAGRGPSTTAPPRLRLKATGTFGTTEMDYPSDREVLESCDCQSHVSFTYRASHISRAIRALHTSTKTSLRIDEEGLLSLQLMMPAPQKRGAKTADAFIEFRCLAIDESMV